MIYLLLILLGVLILASLHFNEYDIIAPSVLFTTSITLGVIFAALYANKWELELGNNTFFVVFGGTLIFIIVSLAIKVLFLKKIGFPEDNESTLNNFTVSKWKLYLFIIFEIFVICYTLYSVVVAVDGDFNSITESIVKYRNINMFSDTRIWLPKILTYSRVIVNASGYWFSYLLVLDLLIKKKVNFSFLIIIMLSMVSSYILGGRNGLINIVVSTVISYFIVLNYQVGFGLNLNWKMVLRLLVLLGIVFISFESLALLIGRSGFSGASGLDYLAIYIGAPIKNLDLFLQELNSFDKVDQSQTFNHIFNWIGRKFNKPELIYSLDLPFRTVNNHILGNVYTVFYPYIYDFGYIGVPVLVSIMAVISQTLYEYVKRGIKNSKMPLIRSIVYAYLANSLVMSFFSNKFYEQHFNTGFIQTVIIWWLFNLFFCNEYIDNKASDIYVRIRGKRK